jgi:hypothetical protein
MIMLAAVVLPALLTPQVRNGQQLRYHTIRARLMTEPNVAGTKPASSDETNTVTVSDASRALFAYDPAMLGQPPEVLRPGVTWTNAIHQPSGDQLWTSTVEEANTATGVVRLRLTFQSNGERGFRGDKSRQDQREDGEAVFVRGVLTKISLQGRQTTITPQRRISSAVSTETSLEGAGSP